MSDQVAAIQNVGDVAKSAEKQMNAARKALMNSVTIVATVTLAEDNNDKDNCRQYDPD